MKYHFIYPDIGTGYYPRVHHGLAQLVAVLRANGHEASLHHVKKEPKRDDIVAAVRKESPDIVGFTTMSNQVLYVELWSDWIKQSSDIPIVCGGVHATLNPKELLAVDSIDAVCVGEGERAVLEGVMGMWHKSNRNIWRNEPNSLIGDLDELSFPDYSLFDCGGMLKARNSINCTTPRIITVPE